MLEVVPMTLREARAYVDRHHRHHRAPQGGLFAIGASDGAKIVGCAIVGKPVARNSSNGWTAEVTRLCTDGTPNTCSLLYAACWRACRAMGYRRLITYILASENGVSVAAAGFRLIGATKGGSWSRASRPRVDLHPTQAKLIYERAVATNTPPS